MESRISVIRDRSMGWKARELFCGRSYVTVNNFFFFFFFMFVLFAFGYNGLGIGRPKAMSEDTRPPSRSPPVISWKSAPTNDRFQGSCDISSVCASMI